MKCHSIVCASPKSILCHRWWTVVIPYQVVSSYTYDQVCDMYVKHILDNFGSVDTTTVAEQQRRATQNTSPDLIFELDMTFFTHFLVNRRNKARFIGHVMTKLENVGVICSQSPTYVVHMISNTALRAAKLLDKPVILIGNDTDLLSC